jgi:hypothetical protein
VGDLVAIARGKGKKGLGADINLEIQRGLDKLQKLKIHTSCSQPLEVGDPFGSLILKGFVPKN